MSPLADLRRRRAERVIAREIPGHEGRIRRAAASSLRKYGIRLGDQDFEDFLQEARLGLYGRLVEGEEIPNPVGFLVTVVTRRALDAKRKQTVRGEVESYEVNTAALSVDVDVAAQLDDEATVRRFIEGARTHLSPREAQAVALTQLFDLTRPKAAEILGVPPKRMEKIMDAAMRKVGAYCSEISSGEWCESRRSLLNAYAFGVLDPAGDRYKLATAHLDDCSACRRYVRNARGIAALLPPVFLPLQLAGAGAAAGTAATGAVATQAVLGTSGSGAAAGGAAVATGSAGGGAVLKAAAVVAAVVGVGAGVGVGVAPRGQSSDSDRPSRSRAPVVVQTRTISRAAPTAPKKPKVPTTKRKSKRKRAAQSSTPTLTTTAPSQEPRPTLQRPASAQGQGGTPVPAAKPSGAEFGVEG